MNGSALAPARRWRRALVPLAAAAAVSAMVAAAVLFSGRTPTGQQAGAAPPPPATPGVLRTAAPGSSPIAAPGIPSPYRVAASVTLEPRYLDCVTGSVCYAWFTQPVSSGAAMPSQRTSDGGATWQQLASPPGGQVLNDMVEPSCPTASVCVAVAQRDTLALTTDGGASWRLDPLPAADSAGWIDQVSCWAAEDCVVHVGGSGLFLSTADGGRNWTTVTHLPGGAPGSLSLLRCDRDGRCIGAVSAGQGTAYVPGNGPGVVVMYSTDHALTWSVSRTDNVPPADSLAPGFLMSCGDALHCLYAGGSGVAITSDGGVTWQQPATPATWQGSLITSVSCSKGLDCSVALAPEHVSQVTVIQTTSNGRTWTAQALPSAADDPLQYVTMLSCPTAGGCAGLASTLSQEQQAFIRSEGFSSGVVQTSPQLLISSLGG